MIRLSTLVVFVFLFAARAWAVDCPTCPTADEVQLQAMLDAAAANGGGVVQLDARVYLVCKPLVVGPNTHLRGAGRGATIIRGSTVLDAFILNNAYVSATIATVGSNHVTVSDLTVDHASCARNANGIAFLPAALPDDPDSQMYRGAPSSYGLVERVEVLGSPTYHAYMIWNLRGQHVKIVNNWLDGGATETSFQEGIESFGGHDVLISGNTVKNVGYACVNVGAGSLENSDALAQTVSNNYLTGCEVGVNLTTTHTTGGTPQSQISTRILGNTIVATRGLGIDAGVEPGTVEGDLIIANNSIRQLDGDGVAAIRLRSSAGYIDGSAVVTNTIQGNHIENITGTNAHGVRLLTYHDVRIVNNTFKGVEHGGVFTLNSDDIEVNANRFEDSGLTPIQLWDTDGDGFFRFVVERNTIRNWTGAGTGILVSGGKYGTVKDNVLSRNDAVKPTPIIVTNGSCSVTVTDNVPWYLPSWLRTSVPACP